MGSTYTSLHYHITFSTKERRRLIDTRWSGRLHQYIGGLVIGLVGEPKAIGGISDHIHLLVSLNANHRIKDFLRELKRNSSVWASEKLCPDFAWQQGYAAFSVSASNCNTVARYIESQEEHHRTKTFTEELRALLRKHGVKYDPRFLE